MKVKIPRIISPVVDQIMFWVIPLGQPILALIYIGKKYCKKIIQLNIGNKQ